ncbi:hypothetical protein ACHQM5_024988 [Ranunculus cassubicifolius]
MSGGFVRNGRKLFCYSQKLLLFNKNSILNEASILSKQQQKLQFRNFSRFEIRKLKDSSTITPPSLFNSSSTAYSVSLFSCLIKNGVFGWYMRMIKSHPVMTKSITSGGIYIAADYSSQRLTMTSSDSYDLLRTLRMAGYGMLIVGPSMHFWFNFMSKVLPKRDVVTTFKKIFVGQAVFGPAMTTVFFSLNAGLQGESGAEIIARLKRDLVPTLTNGLLYWPVCDFVTFKFIPVQLQPLVSNSFAYLWTIYLTYMASLNKVDPNPSNKIALD